MMACILCLTSACSKGSSDRLAKHGDKLKAVNKDDYASLLPYKPSDASQKHASLSTDMTDTFTIGSGLMELSKQYFPPSTCTFREGVFLNYDALDATDGSTGLLGRYQQKKNPIGLNPEVGAKFPTTDGGTLTIGQNDVLLLDIQEFDWYQDGKLKGISLAFALNDTLGDEVNSVTIRKDKMNLYAQEAVRKTVSFLRKRSPEVGNNLPIYVALFNTKSSDETLPGTFFQEAYFKSKIEGTFNDIHDQWVLFPTDEASKVDGTTATSFNRLEESFKDVMPQDVSIVGKGHYVNNALRELRIQVIMHGRSTGEVKTAVQLLNDRLSLFSTGYLITVDIQSDATHIAVIKREKDTSKTSVITLM